MKIDIQPYQLDFKIPGGTSRGILHHKPTVIVAISENNELTSIAEFNYFEGLSPDPKDNYFDVLRDAVHRLAGVFSNEQIPREPALNTILDQFVDYPSIQFGLEQLWFSFYSEKGPFILFDTAFSRSDQEIPINGLVWMGSVDFMTSQVDRLLRSGFHCLKFKIGAINFDAELELLQTLRKGFSVNELTVRVDANGAFSPTEALAKLERLAKLDIHSIEQPIASGQWQEMARLVEQSPVKIALDEELIGLHTNSAKKACISTIKPDYLIFKPSLIGGYAAIKEYADLHDSFWITSALESNIGLNAIAQFTATLNPSIDQGLGTGSLYTNNFSSPLKVDNGKLCYQKEVPWKVQF